MKNLISCTTSDMNFFEEQKYQNMLRDGVNTYVNDQIQNALNQQIERSFVNYDITLTKVVTRKIETAGLGETLTICTGLIPKTVILAIADYESTVIGKIGKNPFNFHHHNLTKLTLLENGVSYPYSSGIELNYTNNEYITGFMSLENCGKSIFGNGISRKDYAKGFTFYAFDMTLNGECGEIKDIDRNGTLRIFEYRDRYSITCN
jgi:hypothetical protein